MLGRGLNSPVTSSVGRLFDVVSAMLGLKQVTGFEGQAAMMLEFALQGVRTDEHYPFEVTGQSVVARREFAGVAGNPGPAGLPEQGGRSSGDGVSSLIIDWGLMIEAILGDLSRGLGAGLVSARFHNTLTESILAVARRVGEERVVLTGGCFQNRYLTERTVNALDAEGFQPYWHQRVPPNDGSISLGQVVAAMRHLGKE